MSIEKIKGALHDVQTDGFDVLPRLPWSWQTGAHAHAAWQAGVRAMAVWLAQHGVAARDAVVVLPQSAHLLLARQAWMSEVGGWMPQFETVSGVLQRLPHLAPDEALDAADMDDALVLDLTIDALMIARRMAQSAVGKEWTRQRPDHAQLAVERVMALAHDWIRVCLSLPPDEQAAYVVQAQQWQHQQGLSEGFSAASLADDMGARERWLAEQALAWALQSWPALVHRHRALFDHRPGAWLLVTVGQTAVPGSEASLMLHVMKHAQRQGVPVCWIPASWGADGQMPPDVTECPSLTATQNFDHEARAAAAWVIELVNQGRAQGCMDPVALITHDRALSRRIRALLMTEEVQGKLVIADESGWTLSTTRAAAAVTRLLAAAHPQADMWDVLDWLLHGWISHSFGEQAVDQLAQDWRKRQVHTPWTHHGVTDAVSESREASLWHWAQTILAPVQGLATGQFTLLHAVEVLRCALDACSAWSALAADEAGMAVLKVLHLNAPTSSHPLDAIWGHHASAHASSLQGLTAWVQQNLARVNYEPATSALDADVVFTPLGKAALRAFAGVVMPGVDEAQLGVCLPGGHLLGAHEQGLGLPSSQSRTTAQWEAFALLSAQPQVRAVYRQNRDGEPCGPSAWLGRWWWQAHAQTYQHHWPLADDPCVLQQVPVLVRSAPAPRLSSRAQVPDSLWPVRLSASAYQRLRDCPYRYFSMDILKLKAVEDMEDAMASNDYGTWLHAVLKRYHEQARDMDCASDQTLESAVQAWLAIADETAECMGFLKGAKRAFFGLYRSTLADLAKHYLVWHSAQTEAGWQWHGLEQSLMFDLPLPATTPTQHIRLYGELDRIDVKGAAQWRVIDYKTGSLATLKAQVKQATEDTQMAFYALLAQAKVAPDGAPIEAMYLRLNHEAVDEVVHEDVQDSAAMLAEGIATDMGRIHQGHAMTAMGEGRLCDRCEARGLCRKDHWESTRQLLTAEKAVT